MGVIMFTFQLNLYDGHAIINVGENVILIDTGAPQTINNNDCLDFCGISYKCKRNYLGLDISKISKLIGTEVTTLLGVDILSDFCVLFDYRNHYVVFSKDDIDFDGMEVKIESFMGIPIVDLDIDHRTLKFFLDSGAKVSHVLNNMFMHQTKIGDCEDFYPILGRFIVECFEVITNLGNERFNAQFGVIPTQLLPILLLSGVDGIIGFDLFNNFKILLDLKNNKLKYSKY